MNTNCDMVISPIALFAYKRLDHLKTTVESLKNNKLCEDSELYIFSDGPRDSNDSAEVSVVREYLSGITGFKEIHVCYRDKNIGLADNLVGGITEVLAKYDRIIVIEDDIEVSPFFLEYMNLALEFYKNEKRVMAVSSYLPSMDKRKLPDYYFLPWFDCWGWGTWRDSWSVFNRDTKQIIEETSREEIRRINYNGANTSIWATLIANARGQIRTWAVFYFVAICRKSGLVLYSKNSLCKNIGLDGSGENCDTGSDKTYETKVDQVERIEVANFPTMIVENREGCKSYEYFYRKQKIWGKVNDLKRKIRKIGLIISKLIQNVSSTNKE